MIQQEGKTVWPALVWVAECANSLCSVPGTNYITVLQLYYIQFHAEMLENKKLKYNIDDLMIW